jgi:tRNA 2-thiouridine synthesizing protein A
MTERNEDVPVLDVRGEICPYPMMKTNEELDKNRPGVPVLDVLTDHPPALSTIPPQAMKRGYEVEIDEIDNGEWRLRLSKA